MTLQEYWEFTETTALYPREHEEEYLRLGLLSEVGEVAGLLKRRVRDGVTDDKDKMLAELGDVCWYAVRIEEGSLEYREGNARRETMIGMTNLDLIDYIVIDRLHRRWGCIGELIRREGFTLDQVLEANVKKLTDRKQRGTIKGSGDNR